MQTDIQIRSKDFILKIVRQALSFLLLLSFSNLKGQVTFVQTLDADFNKGVINNSVISSDNIYLQYSANSIGAWSPTTTLSQTLSGHRTATANNKYVYLVGGYNGSTYSNAVYVATIQSGGISSWSTLNPLPVGLKDAALVVGTNTLYVLGGRNSSQIFNSIYYANINADGTIGSWQTSSVSLPIPLWGHTAVYLNGCLYVAGGSNTSNENSALSSVYYSKLKADNSLNAFTTGTSLNAPRNMHSMVTYNDKIYILGGFDNSGIKTNTVYYSNPDVNGPTGTWSEGTPLPVAMSNHSSVVSNGLIINLAGNTNSGLSNLVYYTNVEQAFPWTWSSSTNLLYDYTQDGAAFQGNGMVYYAGGTNPSGTPLATCRYANLNLSTSYVNKGVFVSSPFFQLGTERMINIIAFTSTYNPTYANCQVAFRTAGSDKIWSDWSSYTSSSPITLNQTKQYLQYKVVLSGQTTYNSTFSDMSLTTPGTVLNGNINSITTFTAAASPYVAFSDLTLTSGTHTFQAGTTIMFSSQTGLSVSQASLICNGTVTDSVKFINLGGEIGQWDGIYYDPNSDNGVTSQFYYTTIANAGYGTNNANLYCYQSNEPLLSHCSIRYADGNGIRLNTANINILSSEIKGNTENGISIDISNPVFSNCSISYNGGAGVNISSTPAVPTFGNTVIDHNYYGIHYPSPNLNISSATGFPVFNNNTYNGVSIDGGDITGSNKTWYYLPSEYNVLGSIRIIQSSSLVRLTIKPGNVIKMAPGTQIQVGASTYGGELFAVGTADSIITFTSKNGLPGGWNGIYFTDYSDNWSGHSQLSYCVIENGNDYNYYSENTVQPDIVSNCKIQNAVTDGARYINTTSAGSITNSQFLNNGRYPLYLMSSATDPAHSSNTYSGNTINRIILSGGTYSFNRTITCDGAPYYILSDVLLATSGSHSRLTVNPGVTLEFAVGKKLQVGQSGYGGDLYAQGTAGSLIAFKAYNDLPGGWAGIYFTPYSNSYSSTSVMSYCTIKQGSSYNVFCETTIQPTFSYCTISNSSSVGMSLSNFNSSSLMNCFISNNGSDGISATSSSGTIQNCQFTNNQGYPIKYNDWTCNFYLKGNTYSGNNPNYIALSGGDYSADRTVYNDGIPYYVMGDIRILCQNNYSRITIRPGVTLAFAANKALQVGGYTTSGYQSGGGLYAIGTADSLISFKSYNNIIGGWGGIFFHDFSDSFNGTSSLKYCKIEKGTSYNIYCQNTSQPVMDHCVIDQSGGNGINLASSSNTITNSTISNSTKIGLILSGFSGTISNNIIDNSDSTGVVISSSTSSMTNCTISNSGLHGISATSSSGTIQNCQFTNNQGYPIKYNDWTCNFYLKGNTYSGNNPNYIALSGGDYSADRTVYNDGIPYYVMGDIRILCQNNYSRITIRPGVTLAFAANKALQVGGYTTSGYQSGGGLYAIGTADSLISFKSYNNIIGGWGGIFFHDFSDSFNGTSSLKYCKIEKGTSYNIYCQNTSQPVMDHCVIDQSGGNGINLTSSSNTITNSTISNSSFLGMSISNSSVSSLMNCTISNNGSDGISATSSSGTIQNCQFTNNQGCPIKYNDWTCNFYLKGNSYAGNNPNYIALSGGDYSADRTVYNDGIPYYVMGDIRILCQNNYSRITIRPGVTLAFAANKALQVGGYTTSGYQSGGGLYAIGTADSLISFKSYSNIIGGWGGIFFQDFSDSFNSTSFLKYCKIEKGASYNVFCENTTQPIIDHCVFSQSSGNGLKLSNSTMNIRNSSFSNNSGSGIWLEGSSNPFIGNTFAYTCNFMDNAGYGIYNNTTNNINAKYNYWGASDSTTITSRIYDKYDNSAKGYVYFSPFVTIPILISDYTVFKGAVKYSSLTPTPLSNATVIIKNYGDTIVSSINTNSSGLYSFSPIPSGSYKISAVPANTWGGVNGTDALRVLLHFSQSSVLSGMDLAVADVNKSGYVNGTDALYIMRRFAGLINTFPTGDFLTTTDTTYSSGNEFTYNLKSRCFGDVNGSFIPLAKKQESGISLIQEGTVPIKSYTEYELPLKIKSAARIGAVSLGLNYPDKYLEILGVELSNGSKNYSFKAENGTLKIAWCELNPMVLDTNETILTIKLRTLDLIGLNDKITFNLDENSEIADSSAQVIDGLVLTIPELLPAAFGINDNFPDPNFRLFPTPFKDLINIEFTLINSCQVTVKLFDQFGQQVASLPGTNYQRGFNHVRMVIPKITPGIYIMKVEMYDGKNTNSKMIKVVASL